MATAVVEGMSDEGAADAILRACGLTTDRILSLGGAGTLDQRLLNYNRAANATGQLWLVIRDSDGHCPVIVRRQRLDPALQSPRLSFRIAHSMIEAWLMADADSFVDYFMVAAKHLPTNPENLPHAKRTLLSVVAKSKNRQMRESVVKDTSTPGPQYAIQLRNFGASYWRPDVAANRSPSLERALREIRTIAADGAV